MRLLQNIVLRLSLPLPKIPKNEVIEPHTRGFDVRIQSFGDIHEQPRKEEQSQEREAHDDGECVPINLPRVCVCEVRYLDGEIAGHETDG